MNKISVIIPCYKVENEIMPLLSKIGNEVSEIIVIDDACPNGSGAIVEDNFLDPRLLVIKNEVNQGVGGAVMVGLKQALKGDCNIFVKIDGDGQMAPANVSKLIEPIILGKADYCKGNRFEHLDDLKNMPLIRLIGNSVLSIMTKFSSGYWDILDPTNGFLAIHRQAAQLLVFEQISKRYFFESDMLFHLSNIDAVVKDVSIPAFYGSENSNMKIRLVLVEFLIKNLRNFYKRIYMKYFLKDFNFASLQLLIGSCLFSFGFVFGIWAWVYHSVKDTYASSGTVMLSALSILLGFHLLMSFLNFDVNYYSRSKEPIQNRSKITK